MKNKVKILIKNTEFDINYSNKKYIEYKICRIYQKYLKIKMYNCIHLKSTLADIIKLILRF